MAPPENTGRDLVIRLASSGTASAALASTTELLAPLASLLFRISCQFISSAQCIGLMDSQLFDFQANCTRSIELYNGLHKSTPGLVPLLRSLLRPDQNVSDDFLSSQLASEAFVRNSLDGIGEDCNHLLCSSLSFNGNADIAGIGAIVAYAFIAVISAVFFLIGYRYDRRDSSTDYDVLADTYFQSIMYFGMSAQIAFWAYLPRMQTMYELTLGQLVTRMIACGIALTYWGMKRAFTPLEDFLIPIGVFGSVALAFFSFFTSAYAKRHLFIDSPCRGVYNVPLTLIQVSAGLYLFCAALVIFGFILVSRLRSIGTILENTRFFTIPLRSWFNITFATIEFLLLWAILILIIVVRERSKKIFGSSYGDNSMGYGQVMAVGFCIQSVVQAGDLVLRKSRHLAGELSETPEPIADVREASKNWLQYRFESVKYHHLRTVRPTSSETSNRPSSISKHVPDSNPPLHDHQMRRSTLP